MSIIEKGAKVRTLQGDIDYRTHAGAEGVVEAFSRFSLQHPREARVRFPDGSSGWFWLSSLERVE